MVNSTRIRPWKSRKNRHLGLWEVNPPYFRRVKPRPPKTPDMSLRLSSLLFRFSISSKVMTWLANASLPARYEAYDCDTYVAWGCNSLKGMSSLRLAGDILDWQWSRCLMWYLMGMDFGTCNITVSSVCVPLLIWPCLFFTSKDYRARRSCPCQIPTEVVLLSSDQEWSLIACSGWSVSGCVF